jgi:hypothetical protein
VCLDACSGVSTLRIERDDRQPRRFPSAIPIDVALSLPSPLSFTARSTALGGDSQPVETLTVLVWCIGAETARRETARVPIQRSKYA